MLATSPCEAHEPQSLSCDLADTPTQKAASVGGTHRNLQVRLRSQNTKKLPCTTLPYLDIVLLTPPLLVRCVVNQGEFIHDPMSSSVPLIPSGPYDQMSNFLPLYPGVRYWYSFPQGSMDDVKTSM